MMHWKRTIGWLTLLGITFWISGCATEAKYRTRVNSWRGKKTTELVHSWGAPDLTEKVQKDHKVLMFIRLKHPPYSYGEVRRDIAGATPALAIHCPTYFEEDTQGKIVSVEYRGEECRWRE